MTMFRHQMLHLSILECLNVCQMSVRICSQACVLLAALLKCNNTHGGYVHVSVEGKKIRRYFILRTK